MKAFSVVVALVVGMVGAAWWHGPIQAQSPGRQSSVTVQATQATITIALWESKSYLIRTTPGQPPSFDPVTIQYLQLGADGPPPPPPPPTGAIEKHKTAVRDATTAVADPNKQATRTALAKLYSTVAGLPVTDRSQLAQATDVLFSAMGLPAPWTAWKAAVDASLAKFTALADARAAWAATGEAVSP